MDNLTHTLVGAALGQAGLKRRTGLAMPALMIGANLPDIDVVCALFGEGLSGRRGWTHGPIGLLVLPALLAVALLLLDRWQARRGTRPPERLPVRPGQLLLLGYVGTLSHPLLDWMNSWGIRLLMPFSERWFYGDVLFIADPWIWLALGIGIWLSRRRERRGQAAHAGPVITALLAVILYSGAMALAGRAAEARVAQAFRAQGLGEPDAVLANPVFADPSRRAIIVRTGDRYGFGDFRWFPGARLTLDRALVPANRGHPAVAQAARQDEAVADFLYWSRYPFATIRSTPDGTRVTLGDARFGDRPDAGPFTVTATVPGGAGRPARPGGAADTGIPNQSENGRRAHD
ncbi:MAG: metal-dependent hydrolase [Sphingomonas sp.]|uniref:metal-dependent hydrolase n=1 Tax=Sphingomonas sp. TaxID=28214 RepID=UPI002273CFCE|nr:metal-dependent hydrolase [Sphingomonas sp.]MCX8475358.1 metal-dependent hydrolase [Sphingomonas sp.]